MNSFSGELLNSEGVQLHKRKLAFLDRQSLDVPVTAATKP